MDNPVLAGGVGCACCACIVFVIVMLATGIKTIETTEWCIKFNWWSQTIDEEPISEPGLKFVGMGNDLIRYPNTNLNVYFRKFGAVRSGSEESSLQRPPLDVRTHDGLSIELELEFTYKLRLDKLRDLYMLVGEDGWLMTLGFLAEGVIDNTATIYTAQEFYLNRTLIQTELQTQLAQTLSDKLYIDLQTLQLQPAHFPDKYSKSITDTQTWASDIEVAEQEQTTRLIQKQTLLKTTRELADKVRVQAEADAQGVMLNNNATVTQLKYRQLKEAQGYKRTADFFAQADPSSAISNLLTYMKTRAMAEHVPGKQTIKIPPR